MDWGRRVLFSISSKNSLDRNKGFLLTKRGRGRRSLPPDRGHLGSAFRRLNLTDSPPRPSAVHVPEDHAVNRSP